MSLRARTTPLLLLSFLVACQPSEAPPPAEGGGPVESPSLMLRVADLPPAFSVETNRDGELVLTAPEGGEVRFELGPEETAGINLEAEVKERGKAFEALPDGDYKGQQQLVAPIGLVFTARGAYTGAEGRVEEIWGYLVHPAGNRKLTLVYRYPPGDSQARAGQLLELLGELEAMESPG